MDIIDYSAEYMKADRITDDVFVLSPAMVLKFNVSLSKIVAGKRYHYHSEYEYTSSAMNQQMVSIKRSFDYYLSFEAHKKDDNGNKCFVRIGPQEYLILKRNLEEVETWFTSKKYKNLYVRDNGKLIMTAPIPKTEAVCLPMKKFIIFTPCIIDRGIANADKEPGVSINFNDEVTVNINLDKFMGMKYLIDCFNMYQAAIILLNYNGKPPYGTNRTIMSTSPTTNTSQESQPLVMPSSGINGRQITPKGIKNNISLLEG